MKNILKLIVLLASLNIGAQETDDATDFLTGLIVSNAAEVTTADSIPVLDGNLKLNTWISAANLVSGLEAINEGNGLGWRLVGRDPLNHGNIGFNAVDFGLSGTPSSTIGATGDYSFNTGEYGISSGISSWNSGNQGTASGNNSFNSGLSGTASGDGSFNSGFSGTASGALSFNSGQDGTASGAHSFNSGQDGTASANYSFNSGLDGIASGDYSFNSGRSGEAFSYGETNVGIYSTSYTPVSTTSFDGLDRLFNIGNGASGITRSNAFTILKNGKTGIGFNNFETTSDSELLQVNGEVKADNISSATNFTPTITYADGTALTYTTLVTSNYSVASDVVTFNLEVSGVTSNHTDVGLKVTGLPAPLNERTIVNCLLDISTGSYYDPQGFYYKTGNVIQTAVTSTTNLTRFIISGSYIKQ